MRGRRLGAMSDRLHASAVVARRELGTLVRGIGGYVALTFALVCVAWLLGTELDRARAGGLLVHGEPFQASLLAAALVLSVFLAVSAVVSVARERERGTLEVLFYGPIDEPSYIAGKFAGQVAGFMVALPVLAASFLLFGLVSGFIVSPKLLFGLLASIVPAAEVIAFGLLLSVVAGRLRTSILLLLGITVLFLGIALAYAIVSVIPIDSPASPILPLRDALAALDMVVDWLSPFAYFERVLESVALGAWSLAATALLAGLGHIAVTLSLATLGLRGRGVRPKGD
jgi:ABC-type transport system involved in multi-copper enzyme maturation permease subunit